MNLLLFETSLCLTTDLYVLKLYWSKPRHDGIQLEKMRGGIAEESCSETDDLNENTQITQRSWF